jgi:DMSO/TMAO reductase YedYZ molybdopterin-dependent catalytic subunit
MVYAYLECGGNQRSYFAAAMGQTAQGTQWQRGGVGMAIWTGVPLREILQRAGITEEAVDVQLIGLDQDSPEGGFRRPVPVAKAMDPDTILAYQMNGERLPADHGFPVRAIVPGWVGSTSVKWLGRIEVSTQKVWSRNNTTSYVLVGDAYPPEGEAGGKVATLQSIKSILILPWPAQLQAGPQRIRGYAYSPSAPIENVAWNDGGSWQEARFIDPPIPYAWRRFEFEWAPAAGTYHLTTRATEASGQTQPESIPFNEKGYLYNAPLAHPVTVS